VNVRRATSGQQLLTATALALWQEMSNTPLLVPEAWAGTWDLIKLMESWLDAGVFEQLRQFNSSIQAYVQAGDAEDEPSDDCPSTPSLTRQVRFNVNLLRCFSCFSLFSLPSSWCFAPGPLAHW